LIVIVHCSLGVLCRASCSQINAVEASICRAAWTQDGKELTFGDLSGTPLKSATRTDPKPFTRVLCFQYKRSLQKAKERSWNTLPDPPPAPSCASEGLWKDTVEHYFKSIEAV
jgi:hypothetical protein